MPCDLQPRLETWSAGDPYRDYCQWPYDPPAAPVAGALRSSAILYHSLAVAGVSTLYVLLVARAWRTRAKRQGGWPACATS